MGEVIATERLTKYYSGQPAVASLDLRIARGTVYGLLGRNGAGKSTAIKMLLGLLHPDAGSSRLLGEASEALTPATRARIAYLAEGHPLYGWMTVAAIVRFTQAFYPAWNRTLVEQILDHFELPAKKKIRHLSRGQRAQLALALAMGPDPELLILDDPTIGLDTVVRRDFLESMIHIIQRQGRTILFSSHILSDVERVADRIGILVDGVLRVDCPTDEFKQSIKRVVLEFREPPAAFAGAAGVISCRQSGKRMELIVIRPEDELWQRLAALQPLSREVIDLNLEDAFIEYTRGRRPALPVFEAPQPLPAEGVSPNS